MSKRPRSPKNQQILTDYRRTRKSLLQKIRRYEKKNPGISIPRPEIPKKVTEGSIRKLERLSEKLSKVSKHGKLEKVYGEKKYETPDGPSLDEIVLDDYMNFIMEAYDDYAAVEHYNNVNPNNLSHGGANSETLRIIRSHADNCMDMLHRIAGYDDDKKKDVIYHLAHDTYEVYTETEVYIYGYQSIKEGSMGRIDVLHTVEEILTRAVEGRELTEKERQDYNDIQGEFTIGDTY